MLTEWSQLPESQISWPLKAPRTSAKTSPCRAAAARNDDTFASVQSKFAGHEICDSGSWLHSVNILDVSESYHPTASGQSGAYEPVFSAAAG